MTEAYKVGITIALTNQISRGLMLIQGDLAKTDAKAKQLHATLKEIKLLGVTGAILGGAGYAGLHALGKTLEAAKEYQQAFAQFKAINLGDAVNKDADKFARGASLMGNSATDLINTVREMHTALGDYGHAKAIAPFIAQMDYANHAIGGKGATAFTELQRKRFGQVIEIRGGFASGTEMTAQADMMQKVMSGTGYMVMPQDYRDLLSRGGIAAQKMSNRAFYLQSEPLVQMFGGAGVGTGMETGYRRMVLGQGAGQPGGAAYVELLDKLGMVDRSKVTLNKLTGKITKVQAGFLKTTAEYEANPYDHMERHIVPGLKALGYTGDQIETAIAMLYGRTGGKVMAQYHRQYAAGAIGRKTAVTEGAMGVDDLVKLARSSPQGAEMALGAAWQNLKIASGEALIPIIIPALNKLAEAIRAIGQWVYRHPRAFDALIIGFAGLSSALLFSGVVLTLKAAFLGVKLIMPTLAAQITGSVIPALTGMAAVLGPLAAIAVAIANASEIGKATDAIGGSDYNPINWASKGGAALGRWMSPPSSGKTVQVQTNLHLDGQKVATAVTKHQADSANRPAASGSGFDGRRGIIQPSWGW